MTPLRHLAKKESIVADRAPHSHSIANSEPIKPFMSTKTIPASPSLPHTHTTPVTQASPTIPRRPIRITIRPPTRPSSHTAQGTQNPGHTLLSSPTRRRSLCTYMGTTTASVSPPPILSPRSPTNLPLRQRLRRAVDPYSAESLCLQLLHNQQHHLLLQRPMLSHRFKLS